MKNVQSLHHGVIAKGLRIKNDHAFEPIIDDFQIKLKKTHYNLEESLVVILLYESSNVATKLEIDITKELLNGHLNGSKEKHLHLSTKYKGYDNELEKRGLKKWKITQNKLLDQSFFIDHLRWLLL